MTIDEVEILNNNNNRHDQIIWLLVSYLLIDKDFSIVFIFILDSNNETKPFVLVDELHLIDKNLTTLSQLLNQRMADLLQAGLPTSNDDLLLLYQEHKVRLYYRKLDHATC